MTDNPTPEEVRASIVPRSDQLNADDLVAGPITVTITNVRRGEKEQPIIVELEGHQPYKPCKTMRRIMIAVFSDAAARWVGQQLTLYCDPEVKWAGVKVGGVRISAMSGLEQPQTFLVTTARGKRNEVTIRPIDALTPDEAMYVSAAREELAAVDSLEQLRAYGETIKNKEASVQNALRPIYAKRLEELQDSTRIR